MEVNLGTESEPKVVFVGGANFNDDLKNHLIALFNEFNDVSAWFYEDMPGFNTDIVVHCLPLRPTCKRVE